MTSTQSNEDKPFHGEPKKLDANKLWEASKTIRDAQSDKTLELPSVFRGEVTYISKNTVDGTVTFKESELITALIAREERLMIKTVSDIAKIAGERVGADPEYTFDAFAEDIAEYAARATSHGKDVKTQ